MVSLGSTEVAQAVQTLYRRYKGYAEDLKITQRPCRW